MPDHLCPLTVSFDAAEKLLDDLQDIHEEPAASRGIIALNRRAAEVVQAMHPCTGPTISDSGCLTCPLSHIVGDTFGMASYRQTPAPVIPPEKVVAAERIRATGQYL